MPTRTIRRIAPPLGLAAAMLLISTASGWAQSRDAGPRPPSAARGMALAERLCSSCHVTAASASAQAGVPSFTSIANRPEQTAARIRNVLIAPHAPMPDMQLSTEEIADITAWLDTLRDPKSGPPLLQKEGDGKLVYPAPT